MEYIYEEAKEIPLVCNSDVLVAGGGPAGACAAIAAARTGAKTILIERSGCLGGTWTTGNLGLIIDHQHKSGIIKELIDSLKKREAIAQRNQRSNFTSFPFNPEAMKILLEELCEQAGVRIRYHTLLVGSVKEYPGKISSVITESKSGREAWRAKVYIDATGDGDLGYFSKCRYEKGHPDDGRCQPMSMLALLSGIDPEEGKIFISNYTERQIAVAKFYQEMQKSGHNASYRDASLFHLGGSLYFYMANHQYGYSADNTNDISKATLAARKEIHEQIKGLRSLGGVWRNLQLVNTASHIGVREGRRIQGLYRLNLEDLRDGVRHSDGICTARFNIDVHSTRKDYQGIEEPPCEVQDYDIPLRSLISADVDNLMMAGRCISGDFYAHASYRVTGNASVTGEAAGNCAGKSAINNILVKTFCL